MSMKVNMIKQMKRRITTISDSRFLHKNLKQLEKNLLQSGYPRRLINSLIFRTDNSIQGASRVNQDRRISDYATIINIPQLTNRIINIFKEENVIIVKKNEKTVGTLYTRLKDRTQNILKSDVIYKLDCKDCDKTYIGHTSQTLKARIAGHKSDSRHNRQRCMLAVHVNENDHHINYEDANVIATERNYKKKKNFP